MTMKTRELCRKYNINASFYQNTFVYLVFVLGLFLIDFATSRLSIDALFSSSALSTNILICLSVCVVFDLTPIGFTPVFMELSQKKLQRLRFVLSIAGFSTVLISLLLFGVLRALTSDLLFDDTALIIDADLATENAQNAADSATAITTDLTQLKTDLEDAEAVRVENENTRQTNETARQELSATMQEQLDAVPTAVSDCETATQNANTAAERAENATKDIETIISGAIPVMSEEFIRSLFA